MKPFYTMNAKQDSRAEILIYEQIGEDFFGDGLGAKRFAEDLKALGSLKSIDVRINSPGGSVWDGQAIYSTLKMNSATVNVFIDGLAASIASVIAMAGDVIYMPENALMMIHDPIGYSFGTSEDMVKASEMLNKVKETIISAYEAKSGLSRDEISKLMSAETWLTATEAKELGLVDTVEKPVKMAANFDLLNQFKKAPHMLFDSQSPAIPESIKNEGESSMPESISITREFLVENHLELVESFRKEGIESVQSGLKNKIGEAASNAAKAEMDRIQEIEKLAMPGHEELINQLKFDGKTTPQEAAMKILAAEKSVKEKYAKNLKEDGQEVVNSSSTDSTIDPLNDTAPLTEEEALALYNSDERVRKQFRTARNFYFYRKNAGK